MFKIGEFSRLTQVSIRMLRYYDEVGLLTPQRIDENSGYRLYAASQIPQLNKITFLRDLGFNVSEISATLNPWDEASIARKLEEKQKEIEEHIQVEKEKLLKIEQAQRDLSRQQISLDCEVIIRSIPSYQVLSLRRVVSDYYQEGPLWKEMAAYAQSHHIDTSQQTFTIYHNETISEEQVDMEVCLPIAHGGKNEDGFTYRSVEAVEHMACIMVYGHFENIAGVFYAFADWLQEHNQYEMGFHSRQIVHRGPWNEEDPSNWVTEIQVPLILRFEKL